MRAWARSSLSLSRRNYDDVAQVSNLLYRRLPVGTPLVRRGACGLEIRDTAGWKPALRAWRQYVTELMTQSTKDLPLGAGSPCRA